jgi:hypothetical protein
VAARCSRGTGTLGPRQWLGGEVGDGGCKEASAARAPTNESGAKAVHEGDKEA